MLCDIIAHAIASESDMEVVGEVAGRAHLGATAQATEADVVILQLDSLELPTECGALFDARPRIKLLGVAADGRRTFLYDLQPQRTALGEVSPQRLVEAIRAAVRPRGVVSPPSPFATES